jgi:hypothetical protein
MAQKQDFNTEDVVALYLCKTFKLNQMPKIKEVVEFLLGSASNFDYNNVATMNQIHEKLIKQFRWLGSLRYNRKELEKWLENIIHSHGPTLTLEK